MPTIDLDEFGGGWWVRVQSADFGFDGRVKDTSACEAENGDVFILKERSEYGFTSTFYMVRGGNLSKVGKKDANTALEGALAKYVGEHEKLPFACSVAKTFKNKSAQVKYAPTQYESFPLKILPATLGVDDAGQYLQGLEAESTNPATGEVAIQAIRSDAVIQDIARANNNSVCIFDAEVTVVEERESSFQGHVTTFYVIQVKGGEAAQDIKKSTTRQAFAAVSVKASENLMTKTPIAVGDVISCRGKLKNDRSLGLILQNVRSINKS